MMSRKWRTLILSAKWDKIKVPIYEASAKGRRVSLLKTLYTNACTNECKYCIFRKGYNVERRTWKTEELVRITLYLWEKGVISGLFLSSGVLKDPETTVDKQIEVAEKLRERGFKGYIHLRLMPGVSKDQVWKAAVIADRIGVNIEAPIKSIFNEIAPDKGDYVNDVLKRLEWVFRAERIARHQRKKLNVKYGYLRAGVDTQVIVGILNDSDYDHLRTVEKLYRELSLKRIYFSPFEPIVNTPFENKPPCNIFRVRRLYQASFLIRDYNFSFKDIETILNSKGMLPNKDPKEAFAEINKHLYPIDIVTAKFEDLVKIPGIGVESARKIMGVSEKEGKITYFHLIRILGEKRTRKILKYIAF